MIKILTTMTAGLGIALASAAPAVADGSGFISSVREVGDILKRVRATMPSGSTLVTIDLHHESRHPNALTSTADVLMLVTCEGGRERSPQQVHALMREAGLTPGRVRHFGPTMMVEATAP